MEQAAACLLSWMGEGLHPGLNCVDGEHKCVFQSSCDRSGKHVLQHAKSTVTHEYHVIPTSEWCSARKWQYCNSKHNNNISRYTCDSQF